MDFGRLVCANFMSKKQLNKPKAKIQTDIVLDLYSNICKESMVNGEEQPLLRRIEQNNSSGWSYIFDTVIYIPVKRRENYEFEVIIKADDETIPTFLLQPARLTLYFKRYSFYADYETF